MPQICRRDPGAPAEGGSPEAGSHLKVQQLPLSGKCQEGLFKGQENTLHHELTQLSKSPLGALETIDAVFVCAASSKPHRHRPSGRLGTGEGSPDGPSSCRRLDLEKPQTQLGSVSEAALILCRAWGKPNSKIVSSSEGFEAKVGSQERNYSSFEKQLLVYFLSLVD